VATVLLDGLGAVGIRAARQLVDTPGLDTLLITARGSAHAAEIAASDGSVKSIVMAVIHAPQFTTRTE